MKAIAHSHIFQVGHPKVLQAYQQEKNYWIEEFPEIQSNLCIIYFSSNGFYFPNNESTFEDIVIKKQRYDWKRLKSGKAEKNIFVRDIFKQFYLDGLNHEINGIEKMLEYFQRETQGMRVVTVGGSSGGWAAVLFGVKLNAERIYSFCGQFDLYTFGKRVNNYALYPLLYDYEDNPLKNKYYDLRALVSHSNIPIFWFLAGKSKMDLEQKELVHGLKNIYTFMSTSSTHGGTIYSSNKKAVLEMSASELLDKLSPLNGKMVSPFKYSLRILGLKTTLFKLIPEKSLHCFRLVRLLFWWGPIAFFTYQRDKKKIQKTIEGS